MNKLYQCKNTGRFPILVVAKNDEEAIQICMDWKHARNEKNIKLKDISNEYANWHPKFRMPSMTGVMAMTIDGKQKSWGVIRYR